jgi:hypothetical protein
MTKKPVSSCHRRYIVPILLFTLISVGLSTYPITRTAYAHTFSGGESASFLALANQLTSEVHLVQSNIPSNITLARDHASDAREHLSANTTKELSERNKRVANDLNVGIEDLQKTVNSTSPAPTQAAVKDKVDNIAALLQEALSVRVEPDQMKNATVHILALNDLLGEINEHYSGAYGIEGGAKENQTAPHNKLVNFADYQSAQSLANKTTQMFNDAKKLVPSNVTSSQAFLKIGTALKSLEGAIQSKKPVDQIQGIIDNQIRKNIDSAFRLKLKTEA